MTALQTWGNNGWGQNRKTRGWGDAEWGVKERDCLESVCLECAVAMRMRWEGEEAQSEWHYHSLRGRWRRPMRLLIPAAAFFHFIPLYLWSTFVCNNKFWKLYWRKKLYPRLIQRPYCRSAHLLLEMIDPSEMTDCKYCIHHLNFYKLAGL